MNKIIISKNESCYIATFTGDKENQIRDLFGSNSLPTPFTPAANPQEVKNTMQKNNPDAEVVLDL